AAIGRTGRLLVREWRGEVVRRTAGTLEHVARIVGAVLDLVLGRKGCHLRRRVTGTAGVSEIAEGDVGQAVTGRAHFLVDLEAALQRAAIVLAQRAGEGPGVAGRRDAMVLGAGVLRAADEQATGNEERHRDGSRLAALSQHA